jgi:hypothetical protein
VSRQLGNGGNVEVHDIYPISDILMISPKSYKVKTTPIRYKQEVLTIGDVCGLSARANWPT